MFAKITIYLTLLTALCSAQEPRNIELRTLCFAYAESIREVTLSGDPEGKATVTTKLLKYLDTKQTKLTLLGNEIYLGEAGPEGTFNSKTKATIPPGVSEVLLVLFPSGNAESPYLMKAYDDSAKAFPLASYQIANMSRSKIRLIVGEVPLELSPGETQIVSKFKNVKKNGQVPYYAYAQIGTDWKRLSSGFWDVIPQKRNFQIAWENPRSKSVEIHGYEDSLPVLKALIQSQAKAR